MGKREGDCMPKTAEMRVVVDNTQQDRAEELRILEALLFAAEGPLDEKTLAKRLPEGVNAGALLEQLQKEYETRGVNLVRVAGKWSLRTAGDLAWLLTHESTVTRKLSRAAIETLSIVAYHQPVTRAEIEDIRGVTTSKGTLDVLLETGWIRLRGRRKAPGRPVTYGTNEAFLSHRTIRPCATTKTRSSRAISTSAWCRPPAAARNKSSSPAIAGGRKADS